METPLQDLENWHYLLVEMAPIAVFVIHDNKIIYYNQETEKIYGYPSETILSTDYLDFIHEDHRQKIMNHFNNQVNSEHPVEPCTCKIIDSNEEVRWIVLKTIPFLHKKNRNILCFQTDISEQKKLVENLEIYQEHLEELVRLRTSELKGALEHAEKANQIKDTFLANMSHEFRTPIHHINSFSKLGTDKIGKAEQNSINQKLLKYFKNIHIASKKLYSFIMNLFDLSCLENGQVRYSITELDFLVVVNSIETEFQSVLENKKLTISKKIPNEPIMTEFDFNWILKSMRCILDNAVKFSSKGSTISIEVNKNQKNLNDQPTDITQIAITDRGIGIPEDELDIVFEKFTQSSRTEDGSGGKGIGLAICKKIISDHQGKIWAENNPEGGTKIIWYIPQKHKPDVVDTADRLLKNETNNINKIIFDME